MVNGYTAGISYWLAANRLPEEDSGWRWIETSPFIFTNWDVSANLSHPDKSCVVLAKLVNGKWFTTECDDQENSIKYNYICKKSSFNSITSTTEYTTAEDSDNEDECDSDWAIFNSNCYKYYDSLTANSDVQNFKEASSACRLMGADLAEIFNDEENEFLKTLLRERSLITKDQGYNLYFLCLKKTETTGIRK